MDKIEKLNSDAVIPVKINEIIDRVNTLQSKTILVLYVDSPEKAEVERCQLSYSSKDSQMKGIIFFVIINPEKAYTIECVNPKLISEAEYGRIQNIIADIEGERPKKPGYTDDKGNFHEIGMEDTSFKTEGKPQGELKPSTFIDEINNKK
jgi:hypothetical protein